MIAKSEEKQEETEEEEEAEKTICVLQYRGKLTEKKNLSMYLKGLKEPCTVIMTLRKLKTVLLSLKAPVEKDLKGGVVYEISNK